MCLCVLYFHLIWKVDSDFIPWFCLYFWIVSLYDVSSPDIVRVWNYSDNNQASQLLVKFSGRVSGKLLTACSYCDFQDEDRIFYCSKLIM